MLISARTLRSGWFVIEQLANPNDSNRLWADGTLFFPQGTHSKTPLPKPKSLRHRHDRQDRCVAYQRRGLANFLWD
jgi:hypothetical protein